MTPQQQAERYALLKTTLDKKQAEFDLWKKQIEAEMSQLSSEIINSMDESGNKTLHVTLGRFTTQTKTFVSVSSTELFTDWIRNDPERIKYATIKPRSREVEAYVKQFGQPPAEMINYERTKVLVFQKEG